MNIAKTLLKAHRKNMQNFQKRNFSGLVVRKDISWILKEIEEPIKQALGKNRAVRISTFKGTMYGYITGFPSGSVVRIHFQCRRQRRHRFHPWVGKIPWRRAWQPSLVFLPGESSWTEEIGGLQSVGSQRVRYNWRGRAHTEIIHSMVPLGNFQ